jgi:hypothetical protein
LCTTPHSPRLTHTSTLAAPYSSRGSLTCLHCYSPSCCCYLRRIHSRPPQGVSSSHPQPPSQQEAAPRSSRLPCLSSSWNSRGWPRSHQAVRQLQTGWRDSSWWGWVWTPGEAEQQQQVGLYGAAMPPLLLAVGRTAAPIRRDFQGRRVAVLGRPAASASHSSMPCTVNLFIIPHTVLPAAAAAVVAAVAGGSLHLPAADSSSRWGC